MLKYFRHSHCFEDGAHFSRCLVSGRRKPSFFQTCWVPTVFVSARNFILVPCPVNAYPSFKMHWNRLTQIVRSSMRTWYITLVVIPLCISIISGPDYPPQCLPHSICSIRIWQKTSFKELYEELGNKYKYQWTHITKKIIWLILDNALTITSVSMSFK